MNNNLAITLGSLLSLDLRLFIGLAYMFVQFFGSFFGALLTRATLSSVGFMDTFIALGILRRNSDYNPPQPLSSPFDLYATSGFIGPESVFANRFQVERSSL